ncbi:HNH endonuclease signature motif containing protein [Streptomyces sp. NPDC048606]|uniref:HNH endonuclease signature motif containing protein n=1 Tax=Streptomyces sp. NPDC048606 TaxID=3154726 RepID=UPI00342FE400
MTRKKKMNSDAKALREELYEFLRILALVDADWVRVGPGVILGGAAGSPFSATASIDMGRYPKVTFAFSSQGNGEALRAVETALRENPWSGTGLHVSGRQIIVTSEEPIRWVAHGHSPDARQASCTRAADWIRYVHTTLSPLLGPALGNPSPRGERAKAAPVSTAGTPALPKQQPACPVCGKALPSGRARHQQCEQGLRGRSVAEQSAARPAGVALVQGSGRYRELVARIEQRPDSTSGRRNERTVNLPHRLSSAREAVLLRCEGRCENPGCTGQPTDVTEQGAAILEVDHVHPLAEGGRDHPEQMVALCPNCHAMKTRGSRREQLRRQLVDVARAAHRRWTV